MGRRTECSRDAVFGKSPISGSKGAGKKPINGFRDAYRRGAKVAGVTTLVNDLAQRSGIIGVEGEQDSGSRYSSMLSRRKADFDRSTINTGGYTGGKQDSRTLCESPNDFSGGIGRQSTGRLEEAEKIREKADLILES